MTNRSKLAAIAMLMMISVATPAFASSFNDDQTTAAKLDEASYQRNDDQTKAAKLDEASYQRNDDQTTAAKLDEASLRQASSDGLTVVPLLVAYADNSSATGGGSDGYNNSTAHDYI